jgi:hypothetical protein
MKTGQIQNTVKTLTMVGAVVAVASMLLFCGCTSGQRADFAALGNRHKVEMYSGGIKVREWISPGYVESESTSDGYYFRDEDSGQRVTVSGDVVITTLAN